MGGITRILAVEDSPTQAIHMKMFLESRGFSVELAENGRVALDKLRQDRPDLVVTDLVMPEMNGLELVEIVNREFAGLPIVLITARGSEDIAVAALRKGASSYVPKKDMESELVPTLQRILAVQQADRANNRLAKYISSAETDYLLDNDDSLVPFLIARLQEELSRICGCDENQLMQIATALDEALVNAIIHGNLEVSSELRAVDGGKPYSKLIQQRRQESPYRERRVYMHVKSSSDGAVFVIRDEGPGFDPSLVPDPTDPANLEKVSGRGLLLINAFMDEVHHNPAGNEIRMVKLTSKPADDE